VIELEHLWLDPGRTPAEPMATSTATPPPAATSGSLEELERGAIQRALADSGGNRKRAAEQLGIGLRTLYEKLKRYGLG
jgi:two-component system response regulator FlrC